MGAPARWNTLGMMMPLARCNRSVSARCSSSRARSAGVNGNVRPFLFLVVPGSSRAVPAVKSTCAHVKPRTSASRQPVSAPKDTTGRMSSGRCRSAAASWSGSKNPWRTLSSASISDMRPG